MSLIGFRVGSSWTSLLVTSGWSHTEYLCTIRKCIRWLLNYFLTKITWVCETYPFHSSFLLPIPRPHLRPCNFLSDAPFSLYCFFLNKIMQLGEKLKQWRCNCQCHFKQQDLQKTLLFFQVSICHSPLVYKITF